MLKPTPRNIKFSLDPETHAEMVALLKKVPTSNKAHINPHEEAFLRCDSPPMRFVELDSPPIFSRTRVNSASQASEKMAKGPCTFTDISALSAQVKIEEEDPYMEHMSVVDGWRSFSLYPG